MKITIRELQARLSEIENQDSVVMFGLVDALSDELMEFDGLAINDDDVVFVLQGQQDGEVFKNENQTN